MSKVAAPKKPSHGNSEEEKHDTIKGEHQEPNERDAQLKARYSSKPQDKLKHPQKSMSNPMKH